MGELVWKWTAGAARFPVQGFRDDAGFPQAGGAWETVQAELVSGLVRPVDELLAGPPGRVGRHVDADGFLEKCGPEWLGHFAVIGGEFAAEALDHVGPPCREVGMFGWVDR